MVYPSLEKPPATVREIITVIQRLAIGASLEKPKNFSKLAAAQFIARLKRVKVLFGALILNARNAAACGVGYRYVRAELNGRRAGNKDLHLSLDGAAGPMAFRPSANYLDCCGVMDQLIVSAQQACAW
jgi:hypothetical protein